MEEPYAGPDPLGHVAGDLVAVQVRIAGVPAADERHYHRPGVAPARQRRHQRLDGVSAGQADRPLLGQLAGQSRSGCHST